MSDPRRILYVGETKAVSVDWSDVLGDSDTIAASSPPSSTWELPSESPPPLAEADSSQTTTATEIELTPAVPGDWEIVNQIVTTGGQTHRRTLTIHVRTK